jgi:hypothetical protein
MPIDPNRLNQARTRRIATKLANHGVYHEADTTTDTDGTPVTEVRRRGPSDPWNDHTHAWLKDILSVIPGVAKVRANTNSITVVWNPTRRSR